MNGKSRPPDDTTDKADGETSDSHVAGETRERLRYRTIQRYQEDSPLRSADTTTAVTMAIGRTSVSDDDGREDTKRQRTILSFMLLDRPIDPRSRTTWTGTWLPLPLPPG